MPTQAQLLTTDRAATGARTRARGGCTTIAIITITTPHGGASG